MEAILLMSAAHLSYKVQDKPEYRIASRFHFSTALQLFRHALSSPITVQNADALMATSILLFHHAWADIDLVPDIPSGSDPLDLAMDPLFSLSNGLREVFMSSGLVLATGLSIFTASTRYRPRESILRAAYAGSKSPADIEHFFERCFRLYEARPRTVIQSGTFRADETQKSCANHHRMEAFMAYRDAAARLAPVLAIFDSLVTPSDLGDTQQSSRTASPGSKPPPVADLARYLFSFPIRSPPAFLTFVRSNETCALLLLLYYYRAVCALVPRQKYWWSDRRARYMAAAIKLQLDADPLASAMLKEGREVLEQGSIDGKTLAQNEEGVTALSNSNVSESVPQQDICRGADRIGSVGTG